jgi:hypothetical protein
MILVRENLPDVRKVDLIGQIRAAAGGNSRIATVPLWRSRLGDPQLSSTSHYGLAFHAIEADGNPAGNTGGALNKTPNGFSGMDCGLGPVWGSCRF